MEHYKEQYKVRLGKGVSKMGSNQPEFTLGATDVGNTLDPGGKASTWSTT